MGINVLFLHDSSLPEVYTDGTVTGKEMRLVQELPFIEKIYAVARNGNDWVGTKGKKQEPKIQVVPIPKTSSKGISFFPHAFLTCWKILRKNQIDLIHAESPIWSGPIALFLGFLFRLPVIVEIRSNYDRLIDHYYLHIPRQFKKIVVNFLRYLVYRKATAIIGNSTYHKTEAIRFGAKANTVFEVNPGLRYDEKKIELWRKKKKDIFTIGFIGRLVESKGVSFLVQAAKILKEEKKFHNFRVLIVGDGCDRPTFEKFTKELGLKNVVKFAGIQPNLEWISKFDILVNTSIETPALDMVNVEAYACGIPVICFGSNGLPETVIHEETGIIVEPCNVQALAEAIYELAMNPTKRQRLADGGKAYLHRRYLYEEQVKRMKNVYEVALREKFKRRDIKILNGM